MTGTLLAVAAMGLVTVLCRATPFLFFMRRKPPALLDYVQRRIPPMIMTILVIGSFKGIDFRAAPHGVPELIAAAAVAALHLWKRNTLISIIGGTGLYMALIRIA
jgi:branched-subunit amino acid transport protein AzlD